jgi:hypothetical protein
MLPSKEKFVRQLFFLFDPPGERHLSANTFSDYQIAFNQKILFSRLVE